MSSGSILFADNDPDFLKTRTEFLQKQGYHVLKAHTLEEAERFLRDDLVHLAILDIRMVDDDDDRDVSGIVLAKNEAYRPVPKIILTGFPSYEFVRETLGPVLEGLPPAVDFLVKQEGSEVMLRAVEEAFDQHVRINWDLTIRWGAPLSFPYLVNLVEPKTDSAHLADRIGELEDLFRKLFYDSDQITISRLLAQEAGCVVLEVFAYGDAGLEGQFVVSCGRRHRIKEEAGRYETFAPKGVGTGSTNKVKIEETVHLAATAYTLIGGDLEETMTFREFYQNRPTEDMLAVLDYLFSTTLAPWYEKGRFYEEGRSLNELYLEWLGLSNESLSYEELEQRVEAICGEVLTTGLARLDHSAHKLTFHLPDGSSVFHSNPARYLHDERLVFGQSVLCGATHGKVDADTVLVDRDGRTWLVDFTQAGHGPLLRDFVSLEMAVKLDLLDTTDLQMRHELEKRLLATTGLDDTVSTEGLPSRLGKALSAVEHIRHLAAALAGRDLEPYFGGLLFCAVGRIVAYDPDIRYTRRELVPYVHSLLITAMLCEKLMGLAELPAQLPTQAIDSLWLDEVNKEVWVEGVQNDLTPQEFEILAYLYRRAGQLCSRRAIVEQALGEEYGNKHTGAATEESRLNSAMSRLRQKIEPDPDRPKYIITIRGQGYKLMR